MLKATRTVLWRRWVIANAWGELVGLGLTFLVGFGAFALVGEGTGVWGIVGMGALMAATGLIEGTVVGLAQWRAMQPALPRIPRRTWWMATLVGALIAWVFGSLPSVLMNLQQTPAAAAPAAAPAEPPFGIVLVLAGGMGAVLGPVLALPQSLVLRLHALRAGRWIGANSLAWALGMPLIFAGINAAQATDSLVIAFGTMGVALLLAGAVVGAIHGIALVRMVREAD